MVHNTKRRIKHASYCDLEEDTADEPDATKTEMMKFFKHHAVNKPQTEVEEMLKKTVHIRRELIIDDIKAYTLSIYSQS